MKKLFLFGIVLLFLAFSVNGQLRQTEILQGGFSDTITVSGKIVDGLTGDGIGGVRIEVISNDGGVIPHHTFTDAQGNFQVDLDESSLALEISVPGYRDKRLTRWSNEPIELFPPNSFKLEGSVRDNFGAVANAQVKLIPRSFGHPQLSTFADAMGNYKFIARDVSVLNYDLEVFESGYQPFKESAVLFLESKSSQDIFLRKLGDELNDQIILESFSYGFYVRDYDTFFDPSYYMDRFHNLLNDFGTFVISTGRTEYFFPLSFLYHPEFRVALKDGSVIYLDYVSGSPVTLDYNQAYDDGTGQCSKAVIRNNQGKGIRLLICKTDTAPSIDVSIAENKQAIQDGSLAFHNGEFVSTDVENWVCKDSASAFSGESLLPAEDLPLLQQEGQGWCSASPLKKDFCKDDYTLVTYTCADNCGQPHEIDCWEQDALCVKEQGKCVKFEDMGWDWRILSNVQKLRGQYSLEWNSAIMGLENMADSSSFSVEADVKQQMVPVLSVVLERYQNSEIRVRAARALGYIAISEGIPESVEERIVSILSSTLESDNDSNLILMVANTLRNIVANSDVSTNVKEQLIDVLSSALESNNDPSVRKAAASALGSITITSGIPKDIQENIVLILSSTLESDNDPSVRKAAASALGSIILSETVSLNANEGIVATLSSTLKSDNSQEVIRETESILWILERRKDSSNTDTALFVIDMQDSFLERLDSSEIQREIPHYIKIIKEAQNNDIPIFVFEYSGHGETTRVLSKVLSRSLFERVIKERSSGFDLPDNYLHKRLQEKGIKRIAITGVTAGVCVYGTAEDAALFGYEIATSGDMIANWISRSIYPVDEETQDCLIDYAKKGIVTEDHLQLIQFMKGDMSFLNDVGEQGSLDPGLSEEELLADFELPDWLFAHDGLEIDTSQIKTNDVVCVSGFLTKPINALRKAVGNEPRCKITLGYGDDYVAKYGEVDINQKLAYLQEFVQEKMKPMRLEKVSIYLTSKEEIKEKEGHYVIAYYDIDNDMDKKVVYYDDYVTVGDETHSSLLNNPERSIEMSILLNKHRGHLYHELVHVYFDQILENPEYKRKWTETGDTLLNRINIILKKTDSPSYENLLAYPSISSASFVRQNTHSLTRESLIDFLTENPDILDDVKEWHHILRKEWWRVDFIPELKDFFETLDGCSSQLTYHSGLNHFVWSSGEISREDYSVYTPSQCLDINEFMAYQLQEIKFNQGRVWSSLQGQFGHAKTYKKNLDLALEHGWITQKDYEDVVYQFGKPMGDLDSGTDVELASVSFEELQQLFISSFQVASGTDVSPDQLKKNFANNFIRKASELCKDCDNEESKLIAAGFLTLYADNGGDLKGYSKQGLIDSLNIAEYPSTNVVPIGEDFFEKVARAKKELGENGITSEQREAYTLGISEMLYRGIYPVGYDQRIQRFIKNLFLGVSPIRDDRQNARGLYLGLPQKNVNRIARFNENDPVLTFGISDYKPSFDEENEISSYGTGIFRSNDGYYYSLLKFRTLFGDSLVVPTVEYRAPLVGFIGLVRDFIDGQEKNKKSTSINDVSVGVMGDFTLFKGQDEGGSYIAYYDSWDLDVPIEKGGGFFGKPFEIYDRIYYNPETYEIIDDSVDSCNPEKPTALKKVALAAKKALNIGDQREFCEMKVVRDWRGSEELGIYQEKIITKNFNGVDVPYRQLRREGTDAILTTEIFSEPKSERMFVDNLDTFKKSYEKIINQVTNEDRFDAHNDILVLKRMYFDYLVNVVYKDNLGTFFEDEGLDERLRVAISEAVSKVQAETSNPELAIQMSLIARKKARNRILYGVPSPGSFNALPGEENSDDYTVNLADNSYFSKWARSITPESLLEQISPLSDIPDGWIPRTSAESGSSVTATQEGLQSITRVLLNSNPSEDDFRIFREFKPGVDVDSLSLDQKIEILSEYGKALSAQEDSSRSDIGDPEGYNKGVYGDEGAEGARGSVDSDECPQPSALKKVAIALRLAKPAAGCPADTVATGQCKDDFILETEEREFDCWEKNALCVKEENKCVKFEDLGWSEALLQNIIILKTDPDSSVRLGATYALRDLKDNRVVPALIKALETDPDSDIRRSAVFALRNLKDNRAVPALIKALETDSDFNVRRDAVIALWDLKDNRAVPALIKALETDSDSNVRRDAAIALRNLKDNRAVPALIKALETGLDSSVRRGAANALGGLKDNRAVPALIKALETDPDPIVKSNAAYALGNLKDNRAVPALIKALETDPDSSVRRGATYALESLVAKFPLEIAQELALSINTHSSSEPNVALFQVYSVLINSIHDAENSPEDIARKTIINNLNDQAVYYLLSLGGADLYTSTFGLLYKKLTSSPDFLNNIRKNIDPQQKYMLGFILTLANYNKLKEVINQDPPFFTSAIKTAMLEQNEDKFRNNGVLLVSTIQSIFEDSSLSDLKPEIEEFLLENYRISSKGSMKQAIFGYNIKLNRDKFSDKNKQEVLQIVNELPEIIEPEVPKEWLDDNTLTTKLYFTQEGQIYRTRDQSFSKFFEFEIEKQTEDTFFMTVDPDSTISDGRQNGFYNGVKLKVILTEDLSDVQQSANDPSIEIIGHRGHSFSELDVFSPDVKSGQSKLVFLGGCGGFGRVCTVQRTLPKAYFISDENTGEGDANDRVLFYIMRSIAQRKNQNKILWSDVQKDLMDSYSKIKAPYPSGIVFPHEKSLLLNPFIEAVQAE